MQISGLEPSSAAQILPRFAKTRASEEAGYSAAHLNGTHMLA
jgi:hypothetical protein